MGKVTDFARKVIPCKSCGAVIVAAGTAQRMGGVDKIMADLGGEPLILRTVRGFQATAVIGEIVIVARPERIDQISSLCREAGLDKVRLVVAGEKPGRLRYALGWRSCPGAFNWRPLPTLPVPWLPPSSLTGWCGRRGPTAPPPRRCR